MVNQLDLRFTITNMSVNFWVTQFFVLYLTKLIEFWFSECDWAVIWRFIYPYCIDIVILLLKCVNNVWNLYHRAQLPCVKDCMEKEQSPFAKRCRKKKGVFKCCILGLDLNPFAAVRESLKEKNLIR